MTDSLLPDTHATKLARAFVKILRRENEASSSQTQYALRDDPVDDVLSLEKEQEEELEPRLAPDLIGATVMLACGLASDDAVLRALRRGAPVVSITVQAPDQVNLVEHALASCALGRAVERFDGERVTSEKNLRRLGKRSAVVFARDGTESSHVAARGNAAVAHALQSRVALIGIAAEPKRQLPRDLMRACEHRVELHNLDPVGIALVIEALTGTCPTTAVDPDLVRLCDLSDLALAIHADLGADGSLAKLHDLLRLKMQPGEDTPTLERLAGYGEAKRWGLDLAADLRGYRSGELDWASIDKGVLLAGPPGVGKTIFAKSLAISANVPFVAGSLAQFQATKDGHLGHTLAAMRSFFDECRKKAPCIGLLDELDSFGDRNGFSSHHKDYSTQVVNALLECLDGSVGREGVVIIGATNDVGRIDPAILRAGRLDRVIHVAPPGFEDAKAILRFHMGPDLLPDVDLGPVAFATMGATGADIAAWVRRAKARARREKRELTMEDLLTEIGDPLTDMSHDLRRTICVHEAGHAVVAMVLGLDGDLTLGFKPNGSGVTTLDLNPRAAETSERDVERHLTFFLAGRAAESCVFGEASVSAGSGGGENSDLAIATRLALRIETQLGFGKKAPLLYVSEGDGELPSLARYPWFMEAISARLEDAYEKAKALVIDHLAALKLIAASLETRRFINNEEVRELFARAGGGGGPEQFHASGEAGRPEWTDPAEPRGVVGAAGRHGSAGTVVAT